MPANSTAPIAAKLVDSQGKVDPVWAEYFANQDLGDIGQAWSPTYTNFTSNGAGVSGYYWQNNGFIDFRITITPTSNTSSTAGSTTFALPFAFAYDVTCYVVTGLTSAMGVCQAATRTCYPPTWSNITSVLTISGRVKAS